MLLARAVAVETPPASESDVGRSILNKAPEGCSVHPQVFYLSTQLVFYLSTQLVFRSGLVGQWWHGHRLGRGSRAEYEQ